MSGRRRESPKLDKIMRWREGAFSPSARGIAKMSEILLSLAEKMGTIFMGK